MTVKELLDELLKFPEHQIVMVNDGENGQRVVGSVEEEVDHYYHMKIVVIGAAR